MDSGSDGEKVLNEYMRLREHPYSLYKKLVETPVGMNKPAGKNKIIKNNKTDAGCCVIA